jgi:hypothetical protein
LPKDDNDTQPKKKMKKERPDEKKKKLKRNKGKKVLRLLVEAKLHGDATSQSPSKPHPSTSCLQNHNDDCVTMLTHMRVTRLGL